jgi:hypothetical protein
VIFGADALKENWETALAYHHNRKLPKAVILKVPHHGARNAMELRSKKGNCWDICASKAKTVILAGNAKRPDAGVFEKLESRTETICISPGESLLASVPAIKLGRTFFRLQSLPA